MGENSMLSLRVESWLEFDEEMTIKLINEELEKIGVIIR